MPRRFIAFVLPSLVAACAASLVCGLAEAAPSTHSPLQALGATGYLSVYALPAGLAISLALRLLWLGWRPAELTASLTEDGGGAPRLAAWCLYLALSAVLLATATFNALRILFARTNENLVVALATPIVVITTALLLVVLSRPSVRGLAAVVRGAERRLGRTLSSPRAVAAAALALTCGLLAFAWFVSIAPRIGPLDVGFLGYLALYGLVLVLVPIVWQRLRWRPRTGAAAVALAGAIAALATGAYLRQERPYSMLEIWGGPRLSGLAVDSLFDVAGLRADLAVEGIRPQARPAARGRPNIVLVTIDTVRADRTPVYGGKAKMPALAELARRGAVFERAYAAGNVTRRSLPTLATGISPPRVRGRVAGWALRLDPRHVTVAERLRAGGYDTAGFFCCASQFGAKHRLGLIRGLDEVILKYDGMPLTEAAVAWLSERKRRSDDDPLFLWLHYIEPHNWMKDQKGKGKNRRERYDASLEETDTFLARLTEGLRAELGDDTIVVLTSDHGEGLGDHGVRYHSGTLHDTEVRVPLIVTGPAIEARRIREPVGLVDLAPTILELAGFEPPGMPAMDGLSIAALLRGDERDEPETGEAYAVMLADRSVEEEQRAIVSGRYKLIEKDEGRTLELYDLEDDPDEKENLRTELPEVLNALKARLDRRRAIDQVPPF